MSVTSPEIFLKEKRWRIAAECRPPAAPIPRPSTCWSGHALTWNGDKAVCSAGDHFRWTLNMTLRMALCVDWQESSS